MEELKSGRVEELKSGRVEDSKLHSRTFESTNDPQQPKIGSHPQKTKKCVNVIIKNKNHTKLIKLTKSGTICENLQKKHRNCEKCRKLP